MNRLQQLLDANDGVLIRSEHPRLGTFLSRCVHRGALAAVLPGVYVDPDYRSDPQLLTLAALRRFPNGVLQLHSAARLTFWPELAAPAVQLAGVRVRQRTAGFAFTRRPIPPDWVTERELLRLSSPEYTAIDLATATDGESIDQLLRQRMGTIEGLRDAHNALAGSHGQQARARLLLDSRERAWSAAERLAHRIFRAAGITNWQGNYKLRSHGRVLYLDIAFRDIKLVVEIDGYEFHTSRDAFENERERQNFLVLDGWIVLRFTWTMLTEDPDYVVRTTQDAIDAATRSIAWRR